MENLLFIGPLFADMVIAGQKNITMRKFNPEKYHFKTGDVVKGNFDDESGVMFNILLKITEGPTRKPLSELTCDELSENGLSDHEHAYEVLRSFYPDLQPDDDVVVIKFEVAQIDGEPVVSFDQ